MIALRFTRNKGIVSHLIRWFTWSDYSHVEFALPGGYLGALGDGGVQLRSFDYAPGADFVFRYIDCTNEQYNKIVAYAMEQRGKPYDWMGIIGIVGHRDWHSANHWFCAELVVASLERGGIYLFREPMDRITPQMLFELEAVKP